MKQILKVGIDASINSTGVVIALVNTVASNVWKYACPNKTTKQHTFEFNELAAIKFYRIVSSEPKSSKSLSKNVRHISYYRDKDKFASYAEEDIYKIQSADKLAKVILKLVIDFCNEHNCNDVIVDARIEGSVMATSFRNKQSRLNDLTAFNTIIKLMLLKSDKFDIIHIVPPTTLKKIATGSGRAKKEDMEYSFKIMNDDFDYTGKVDDVIDAWFLALSKFDISEAYVKD